MNTETTTSGWLLVIAGALCLLGALVIVYVRSERAENRELRAENERLRLANARANCHPAFRVDVERDVRQSLDIAAHTLAPVGQVLDFPTQREAGERS